MALTTSGTIRFSELQTEFGGTNPINASEYYRDGSYVSDNNTTIPTTGSRIDLSDFYGGIFGKYLTYEIIGGGGGGGHGVNDGGSSGSAPVGGSSSLNGSYSNYSISVVASGGAGGANGAISRLNFHGGEDSFYGAGGAGGNNKSAGGNAPSTSYGAGGGGGGGDSPSLFDSSGNAGIGGYASQRLTGTVMLVPSTVITVVIGDGGAGSSAGYRGGSGAGGYARLQVGNTVGTFTSGTNTFTVP